MSLSLLSRGTKGHEARGKPPEVKEKKRVGNNLGTSFQGSGSHPHVLATWTNPAESFPDFPLHSPGTSAGSLGGSHVHPGDPRLGGLKRPISPSLGSTQKR